MNDVNSERDGKAKIKITVNTMITIHRMSGEITLTPSVRTWVRVWPWVGICLWVETPSCLCLPSLFGSEVIWRSLSLVSLLSF